MMTRVALGRAKRAFRMCRPLSCRLSMAGSGEPGLPSTQHTARRRHSCQSRTGGVVTPVLTPARRLCPAHPACSHPFPASSAMNRTANSSPVPWTPIQEMERAADTTGVLGAFLGERQSSEWSHDAGLGLFSVSHRPPRPTEPCLSGSDTEPATVNHPRESKHDEVARAASIHNRGEGLRENKQGIPSPWANTPTFNRAFGEGHSQPAERLRALKEESGESVGEQGIVGKGKARSF